MEKQLAGKHAKPKRERLRIQVHITDHCNLNCVGCDNFAPIADEKYLPVRSFEKDCKRLAQLCSGDMEEIVLQGGEPLLHKDLTEFFAIARKYFPQSTINVVSNGLLLPRQSAGFWQSCRENDIHVIVTKYPVKLDFCAIIQKAKDEHVYFDFFRWKGGRQQLKERLFGLFKTPATNKTPLDVSGVALPPPHYEKTMNKMPLDVSGKRNIERNFTSCFKSNVCICLDEGKLYTCPTVAYISYFNKQFGQNLTVSKDDYIDIYEAKTLDEILDFLSGAIPFCRYCDISNTVTGLKWGVSKKNILEWTDNSGALRQTLRRVKNSIYHILKTLALRLVASKRCA